MQPGASNLTAGPPASARAIVPLAAEADTGAPWRKLAQHFLRFGIVGIAATLVHLGVAFACLSLFDATALQANLAGFAVAVSISFSGHCHWVFRHRGSIVIALVKFVSVSLLVLLASSSLSWLVDHLHFDPLWSLPLVALAAPPISYLGYRFWVFGREAQ